MTSHSPHFLYRIVPETYRTFKVIRESEDDIDEYFVRITEKGFRCSCKAYCYGKNCKHVLFVKEYLATGVLRFEEDLDV